MKKIFKNAILVFMFVITFLTNIAYFAEAKTNTLTLNSKEDTINYLQSNKIEIDFVHNIKDVNFELNEDVLVVIENNKGNIVYNNRFNYNRSFIIEYYDEFEDYVPVATNTYTIRLIGSNSYYFGQFEKIKINTTNPKISESEYNYFINNLNVKMVLVTDQISIENYFLNNKYTNNLVENYNSLNLENQEVDQCIYAPAGFQSCIVKIKKPDDEYNYTKIAKINSFYGISNTLTMQKYIENNYSNSISISGAYKDASGNVSSTNSLKFSTNSVMQYPELKNGENAYAGIKVRYELVDEYRALCYPNKECLADTYSYLGTSVTPKEIIPSTELLEYDSNTIGISRNELFEKYDQSDFGKFLPGSALTLTAESYSVIESTASFDVLAVSVGINAQSIYGEGLSNYIYFEGNHTDDYEYYAYDYKNTEGIKYTRVNKNTGVVDLEQLPNPSISLVNSSYWTATIRYTNNANVAVKMHIGVEYGYQSTIVNIPKNSSVIYTWNNMATLYYKEVMFTAKAVADGYKSSDTVINRYRLTKY